MNKVFFWLSIFSFTSVFIYLVSKTLAPFIIAFIIAYLLQPVIENNCKRFNLPRSYVTLGVFGVFVLGFGVIMLLFLPIIYQQFAIFINKIPYYKNTAQEGVSYTLNKLSAVDPEIANKISESARAFVNTAFSAFASFANYIWSYTLATINIFVVLGLVPIILYYFLRDWPIIVSNIESVLPIQGKSKVREIFTSINQLLSAYIRGQLNICLILSAYYITGFTIIGIDLPILFGIMSGFLIIIPFVGAFLSFSVVAISCYFTYGYSTELLYITILFVVGHVVESYILSPKIIGDKIGLHPLWIMFAVFASGSILGFVGVLFAIPIAGIIKVLFHHFIEYYKSSDIYKS